MLEQWKARIGWINPRVNSDIEVYDFYQVAPKDVVLVVNSLIVVDSHQREEVEASLALVERAVEHLNLSHVDLVMMNGAPVHLHFGNDGHAHIIERMRRVSKAPVTTSSEALADSLGALGAKKLLVVSSWRTESVHLSTNLRNYLASRGVEIVAVEGIGRQLQSFEKLQMTPKAIYDNVAMVAKQHPGVDAVYIQSGTMAAVPIIEQLEHEVGKPVISSNSASIFTSLRMLGLKPLPGFGQLLSSL
jgi:maleate cis-trans isomerase